jgi:hypothetical protein
LVQGQPKRNTAIAQGKPAIRRPPRAASGSRYDLFDRNREPPDQPRNLVQMLGILIPDGLREPNDAFVIAHRGYVVWDHRRHRPYASGQDVWHRITSSKSGTIKRRRRMSRFGDADERFDLAAACPIAILLRPKRATNRCSHVISAPYRCGVRAGYFVLCKARRLCYTLPLANPWFRLFLGSSAVEHSTVNRMVAGSNPARGAKQIKHLARF